MRGLAQDVRFATRMLARSPVFALVAIVVLAIGIGANTAIFSVVDGVLLRPLPYPEPERLVAVWETNDQAGPDFRNRTEVSPANLLDWQSRNQSFEQIGALAYTNTTLVGREQPERLAGAAVTPNFFAAVGVTPAVGRAFEPGDGVPNAAPVAILSAGVWRRAFGADPDVVGTQITMGGRTVMVAGVMPDGFDMPFPINRTIDVWTPLKIDPAKADRQSHFLYAVGRLRDDVTREAADAEMDAVAGQLAVEHPDTNRGREVNLVELHSQIVGDVRGPLGLLFAAVAGVLLVACGNVANMLLARTAHRRREIALRTALGGSRARIVRQLLTESTVLALAGGALGLALAWWSLDLLRALGPADVPRLADVGVRWPVFLFAVGASLATALVFGLGPALRSTGVDLAGAFKAGSRTSGAKLGDRARGLLVVAEVAVTIVLLVGAGLLVRSFVRLLDVDPGFDPKNALTLDVAMPRAKYEKDERAIAFTSDVLARVRAIPGVEAVGTIDPLPLSGSNNSTTITIGGQPIPAPADRLSIPFRLVTPGYFEAMGIPVLSGRSLADRDRENAPRAVVVSAAFARRFWPDAPAVGQNIHIGEDDDDPAAIGPAYEIVGVVGDVRHSALDAEPQAEFYVPYLQEPSLYYTMIVRSSTPTEQLVGSVRDAIRSVDPDQPIHDVMTMDQRIAESVARRRFAMLLAGAFAVVALLIASVGLYGVLAYFVEQREREIGVRMALGARRADVLRLVLGHGLGYTTVGLALGSAVAALLSGVLAAQLFGVSPVDPATYASIDAVVFLVAVAATFIPALRATAVDPAIALRSE